MHLAVQQEFAMYCPHCQQDVSSKICPLCPTLIVAEETDSERLESIEYAHLLGQRPPVRFYQPFTN